MKIYKYGKIVHVNKNYIILENNREGELVYVPDVKRFKKDESAKIFIHEYETDHAKATYGFENFKELVVFEDLLAIQGIGPKTAIAILNEGWENIIQLIAKADLEKLSTIPFLSTRSARQLIFEYQVKYEKFVQKMMQEGDFDPTVDTPKLKNESERNVENSLKLLGFRQNQIKYALENINVNQELEKAVEEAIKIISLYNTQNAEV